MKGLLEKAQREGAQFSATLASLLKVALMSRSVSSASGNSKGTLVVMGNGPSLRTAIDEDGALLKKTDLLSVNFAPLAEDFVQLRPKIHVLADGVFFDVSMPGNVGKLWEQLGKVDWEMSLYIPVQQKRFARLNMLPQNVRVKYFNLTPVEGWKSVRHLLYKKGWGMPRPRNVLIPSIMIGIMEGYGKIALIGADHSWSKTLWVTDSNRVVSVQPHFYKDNEKERERVESLYKDIRLHQIYESFAVAFRSYFAIEEYARSRGVEIINCTPGSFIDAFPREKLQKVIGGGYRS
ncbi:MAG: hypothetical protein K2G53_02770 [Muribaculaceae bacterium]|nr:hypothetical protein [Muribaculaceae bacterium]